MPYLELCTQLHLFVVLMLHCRVVFTVNCSNSEKMDKEILNNFFIYFMKNMQVYLPHRVISNLMSTQDTHLGRNQKIKEVIIEDNICYFCTKIDLISILWNILGVRSHSSE